MSGDAPLSVHEVADRLGVTPGAVRQRIAAGELPAVKHGRDWWISERDASRLSRRRDGPGQPLAPAMAWAILSLASADEEAVKRLLPHPRYRARARAWLRQHRLTTDAGRLRARAIREAYDAHPSELARLSARDDVLLTGASAGEVVGLVGQSSTVELYAPAGRRAPIIADHVLAAGGGNVIMRWIPDDVWSMLDPRGHIAPRAAVLLDLAEGNDPRGRREAARALAAL
jgi:excisionase family DNA binding protein